MNHNTDQPKAPESKPAQDEVAKKAYALYVKEDRPQGHAEQNWLEAEAQLQMNEQYYLFHHLTGSRFMFGGEHQRRSCVGGRDASWPEGHDHAKSESEQLAQSGEPGP